jgi:Reverse transcriptase (RNA-dependent DNA polymerase)
LTYDNIASKYKTFISMVSKEVESQTFLEANKNPIWQKAKQEELDALKNNTWDIIKLPQNKILVGSRWIYKIKYNSDGTIERYKTRLVAKGYIQTYGINCKETFASVAKMNTVKVLLLIAINLDWDLYQMNVKNIFLQGVLQEEVYMNLPPDHPHEKDKTLACKLNKSIYGLKQSPRAWYAKLSSALIQFGFMVSNSDHSMFVKHNMKCTTMCFNLC